jgi:hypothetical protein
MQPEAIGFLVGSVLGAAVCVGLLILAFKMVRSIARSIRLAIILVGLLAGSGAASYFGHGHLSPQQKDQITKFFESLADQARGVFYSQTQPDDPSVTVVSGEQSAQYVATDEISFEISNPLIDLSTCVKE